MHGGMHDVVYHTVAVPPGAAPGTRLRFKVKRPRKGLEVRREQLRQQPQPAARHVHFSVSEDSRPRSSSRLSARTQQSDATEVSEEDVPVVSPVREPSPISRFTISCTHRPLAFRSLTSTLACARMK